MLSFNKDTRRPEEFLPSILSLLGKAQIRASKECDQIRSGNLALAREERRRCWCSANLNLRNYRGGNSEAVGESGGAAHR